MLDHRWLPTAYVHVQHKLLFFKQKCSNNFFTIYFSDGKDCTSLCWCSWQPWNQHLQFTNSSRGWWTDTWQGRQADIHYHVHVHLLQMWTNISLKLDCATGSADVKILITEIDQQQSKIHCARKQSCCRDSSKIDYHSEQMCIHSYFQLLSVSSVKTSLGCHIILRSSALCTSSCYYVK